jgi:hypothetical protein
MGDYINYLDITAQKMANLAIDLGDYQFAIENYLKVKTQLYKYQGDSMIHIMMAADLNKKIQETEKRVEDGQRVFFQTYWTLTKSSFVKGSQCIKCLHLDTFKRLEKTPPSKELQEIFNRGYLFEKNVRDKLFPEGINVKEKVGDFTYFNSYTAYLIGRPEQKVIYEATVIEDDVFVMCDILVQNEDRTIDIYEIKSSTAANDAILSDLSVQYAICKKRFQSNLRSFNLVLRKDTEDFDFEIVNFTEELDRKTDAVNKQIVEFKSVLKEPEPKISMGEHCQKPYECEFKAYCIKNIKK